MTPALALARKGDRTLVGAVFLTRLAFDGSLLFCVALKLSEMPVFWASIYTRDEPLATKIGCAIA